MSLKLRSNNPYVTGYTVDYLEGDQSLQRFQIEFRPSDKDKLHPVTDYDNLSDIAFDHYGDSKYWWVIADVNNIMDPFTLTPNTNLIIPDLDWVKTLI